MKLVIVDLHVSNGIACFDRNDILEMDCELLENGDLALRADVTGRSAYYVKRAIDAVARAYDVLELEDVFYYYNSNSGNRKIDIKLIEYYHKRLTTVLRPNE